MVMGVIQADLLPKLLGFEHPATWIVASRSGLLLGVVARRLQGFVIAYLGVPSFIVTLGGLLVWRGAAWWVTTARRSRRSTQRSGSWAAAPTARSARPGAGWSACVACVARRRCCWRTAARRRKTFRLPAAADGGGSLPRRRRLRCSIACRGRGRQRLSLADRQRAPLRRSRTISRCREGGCSSRTASPIPVLIAIGVGVAMTFVAERTRFGRYVFAIGGNPEAAELAGINTRWVIVKIFMLMGLLAPSAAPYRSRGSTRRPIRKARSTSFW